ncbi:hypothetical protein B0F90DRAFT_1819257 [Multifurca ochricompacta]|uniref:UvrD-like helicase ATP-binding domain-containing protein n=1 Tax=Multifurca ochricompacta TaxID=376703 RepID=A0AAD4M2P4_9AGAM|nr:hypothetical protein B0F90DRAFT_1819257 [Multifurca ochricompacta]
MKRSRIQSQTPSVPKDIVNSEWFQPERLRDLDDDALHVALQSIQRYVRQDTLRFVFECALERNGCIEFLLSSLSHDSFFYVLSWINEVFPTDLDNYSANSLYARILSTISVSLLFLQYPNEDDRPEDLGSSHQYVVLSSSALESLVSAIQGSWSEVDAATLDEEALPVVTRKKASQKARKYAKSIRKTSKPVDSAPFRSLQLDVPASSDEAREMALGILAKQREILITYLCLFRLESLSEVLKRNYIPSLSIEATAQDHGALTVNLSDQITETPVEVPAVYPQVQPMRAALYFDSAEGFGQWRILISGRANRNLRQLRNKDITLFKITLKKIRELSNGHFSDDNQKRLTGANILIPIYEAKMTRDSRLVYQVDCVPDYDSQVGVSSLRPDLLVLIPYHPRSSAKVRFDSCTFRAEPVHKGDKVVPPASFPAVPPSDLKATSEELPIISDDVREEVCQDLTVSGYLLISVLKLHEILVLEKFVVFSQALLKSILADQEAIYVFQVSPHEQEIIEHAHSCFENYDHALKMLGIENSWQQNRELRPERPRQLFVTQSRMLADKVEEYFIKLLQSLVPASQTQSGISDLLERQKNREEAGLVDQDEAANWRDDLPRRFSELTDMDHPSSIATEENPGPDQEAVSSEYMLQRRKSFISFDVFREEYWAHFPQLIKGLDVSLVFSEFLGVIKGSEMTLDMESHFLDHDTYLNLSTRTQATFSSKRKEIYTLFETYLKMKRDRREYDAADRVAQHGMKGQKIDFLYVDEVQDNMLIDAKLLRAICRNPNGQFWAGDTAQTISVGSSFRFDDLKAFLYRNEEQLKHQFAQMIVPRQPKSFQLATNFRSHGGIVKCAHSIIVLITRFWPYAIDILPEEKGIVDGIKPVFFSGWDQDNVRYESFLFGTAGHHIEFGAHQCILVRNEAAKEKFREQVGDIGLIMTLYESKGLEFNDVRSSSDDFAFRDNEDFQVLIYNFFEDSSVDVAQWRVVLNAIDRSQREKNPAPTFDEIRHAGVCAELKFLYVAITRARKHCWIFDRSKTAEPMRIYWSSGSLVQNCTPGTDVPQLAVSSTPEEWAKMAKTLFSHKRYFQAMHSYERAGMVREKAIAHAYHFRELARGIPVRNHSGNNERRNAYTKVAEAFLASAQVATISRERSEYYRIAAEAFVVLEDHAKAAQAFEKASKFTEAAQHYRHAGMFDETVSVIKCHGDAMDSVVASKLTDVARYYYLQEGNFKKASSLFSDTEEELEFVRDCDLDIAEVKILVGRSRFIEAADLHIRENRTLDAVEVLLMDKTSKETAQRASESLLRAFWNVLPFGVLPNQLSDGSRTSLRRAMLLLNKLDLSILEERTQRELQMFTAIYKDDIAQLMTLGTKIFHSDQNRPAALLCFDHFFRDLSAQVDSDLHDTDVQTLSKAKAIQDYSVLVQEILFILEPWTKQTIQKLFLFSVQSGGHVCLPRGTFLYDYLGKSRQQLSNEDVMVGVGSFHKAYQSALRERAVVTAQSVRGSTYWTMRGLGFEVELGQSIARKWFERFYEVLNPIHYAFGSFTNITLHANRQTSQTFHSLKTYWIWPMLNKLDPNLHKRRFMTTLLSLADLGSFIDDKALVEHVNRTRLVQNRPPSWLMPGQNGHIILGLVEFLRGSEKSSVHAGAMFIQHILNQNIPVEITVLCRFLELVVSSFVMASALNRMGSLHGVTLPRSWILKNVQHLYRVQNKDAHNQVAWQMTKPFQVLLERVYSGHDTDHLQYQNKPLHSVPFGLEISFWRGYAESFVYVGFPVIGCNNDVAHRFILVGFNFGSQPRRDLIFESITSLRRKDGTRMFSSLYSQYVYAQHWGRLATVVTSSISPTPLDEMITLMDERKTAMRTFSGVRPVKFKDVGDISRQLTLAAGPVSTLNPSAAPFAPNQALVPANDLALVENTADEANEDDTIQEASNEEDTEPPEDADVAAIFESIGTKITAISEEAQREQHRAAKTLQHRYRRLLASRAHRVANPGLGLAKARQNQFEAFAQEVDSIEWPKKSRYRLIFLGALPHLLVCLSHSWSIVMEEKGTVKRRQRQKQEHQIIEDHMRRQSYLNTIIKRIEPLQTRLQPRSDVHKCRNLKTLEVDVEKVLKILDEIPRAKEELAFDMTMACAWKRHVKEEWQKRKVEKPELNTDDLDGL